MRRIVTGLIFLALVAAHSFGQALRQNGVSLDSITGTVDAGQVGNGPLSSSVLPSTVAYRSIDNNWSATQTFSSSITYKGASNGVSAPEGYVGQISSTTLNGACILGVTGVYSSVSTMTLTAGNWLVTGTCNLVTGGTTNATLVTCCISDTANGCDSTSKGNFSSFLAAVGVSENLVLPAGSGRHYSISSSQAVYTTMKVLYTVAGGASCGDLGHMRAIRLP